MLPALANFATPADVNALLPASIVALTALVALFFDLLVPAATRRILAVAVAMIGLAAAGAILAMQYHESYAAFGGSFIQGGYSVVLSEIIVVATLATLTLGLGVGRDDQVAGSTALMLWSASGAMLMTGAGNLMTVFLGLELLSLGLYCLCAISVRPTARESALKYLILSSMASGFLLFGMALVVRRDRIRVADGACGREAEPAVSLGQRAVSGRDRVQAEPRSVSQLGAGRLRRGSAGRHRVHVGRDEGRCARRARTFCVCVAAARRRDRNFDSGVDGSRALDARRQSRRALRKPT